MKHHKTTLYILATSMVLVGILTGVVLAWDTTNVQTQVNITQGAPIVSTIAINSGGNVNLSEGSLRQVWCNATIVDYNGLDDISKVNATFFRTNGTSADGYGVFGAADNNSRYHNVNCTYNATIASWTYSYLCDFNVTYHAYNGTWNCTVWANNSLSSPRNSSNASWVSALYAINVTAAADFGNLSVFDTSNVSTINVTNFGNMPINLTVYGFGNTSNATGAGWAFVCPAGTNISVGNLRYTLEGNADWSTMTALTNGPALIDDLTIEKQSGDENKWNTSYWKLYIPPNPFGLCNGTIVFEAIAGGN
jgi:hypothetical protein